MTGAAFRQVDRISGPVIAVGRAAAQLGLSHDGLGEEGYWLRTVGESIGLLGAERGALYGVYEFLEQLGCRFFTATCEQVPLRLTLPELDRR